VFVYKNDLKVTISRFLHGTLHTFNPLSAKQLFVKYSCENLIWQSYRTLKRFVFIRLFFLDLKDTFFDADVYVSSALTGYIVDFAQKIYTIMHTILIFVLYLLRRPQHLFANFFLVRSLAIGLTPDYQYFTPSRPFL